MNTKEKLTIQEIEQLCQAYMDCRLTRLQEKELELVIICSDVTSPKIDEVRAIMGLSILISMDNSKSSVVKKAKLHITKHASIAACVASIVIFAGYFISSTQSVDETRDVYVCVDGKELTGPAAQTVIHDTEEETMNLFHSIIKDVEKEQLLSEQYMNTIIEELP